MSYVVLARKYRSNNFDELIGQEHIAQTLKKAIASARIAHAYLFCGTRGTGKTSTARILAKCLNCEKTDKPTGDPCGKCNSCVAIARGEDIDCIEIDAASNTGVDNVRDIIANSQFHPARSRFKIYIIDEVHMLSKQAFNALLKTLEEPPSHVKFILATTEPEKVLPTILSRCQRYDFRNIPTREIAAHLKEITRKETIEADEDALFLVAKAGAGSMRDSLSLLDRLLSVGEKELTVEMIEQLLGLPRSQLVFDLAQAIGEADVKAALTRTEKMIAGGLAADTLIASLVDHLRNLLIIRTCGPDSTLVEVPGLAMKDLQAQAARFDPVVLTQDIALLEELRRQMRSSQAGRALLDASLVRLALAEQFNSIGEMLSDTDGASASPAPSAALKKKRDDAVTSFASQPAAVGPGEGDSLARERALLADTFRTPPVAPTQRGNEPVQVQARERDLDAQEVSSPPASVSGPALDDDEDADALPAVGKVWDTSGPSLSELLKQRTAAVSSPQAAPAPAPADQPSHVDPPAAEASNVEPIAGDLPAVWQQLLVVLSQKGPGLHSVLSHGRLTGIQDGQAVIRYERRHETFVKMLERNGKKDAVRDALTQVVGSSMGVRFEVDESLQPIASATAAPPAPQPAMRIDPSQKPDPAQVPVRREPVRRAVEPEAAPVAPAAMAAPVASVRVTPELIESLRNSEPLIRGLMDELGATIVKIEPAEAVVTG